MNKLIEPLYAEPIESYFVYGEEHCQTKDVRELEQLSNEMLDYIIKMATATYNHCMKEIFDQDITDYERKIMLDNSEYPIMIGIIEKATNKSWEEKRSLYESRG